VSLSLMGGEGRVRYQRVLGGPPMPVSWLRHKQWGGGGLCRLPGWGSVRAQGDLPGRTVNFQELWSLV